MTPQRSSSLRHALLGTAVAAGLGWSGCAANPPAQTPAEPPAGGAALAAAPAVVPPRLTGPALPVWESVEEARGAGLADYRLGPGDVIDILVVGHEDLRRELPVRPDGKISFTYVGDLVVAGLTTEEFRAGLEKELTRFLRFPQVTVLVKKARAAQFAILGKVVSPGMYPIDSHTTIITALALAQGLASGQYEGSTIEVADLKNAYLVRRGKVVPVDFEALVRRGDTREDVALEDGDYLYLPSSLAQEVHILGEVFKPRAYGFRGRVTLLQAVAESGGFKPTARLGDVVILREVDGEQRLLSVDVRAVLDGTVPDPELAVGDIVYVPRRRLASFAQFLNEILPSLLALQLGRTL
ncbi:MAG: polysaccharide biosynthesis/export family protein [Thermoanaerobaculia bacterium]|nr:polysaccharide biosynthesis/export family protein [Thermoanaerobaculia bacterium]MBP9825901.1 polysaccharide biosynthesis/export family protein [Thermoanaerobaculia bacterium]